MILALGMDKTVGYQIGFIITAVWWGLLTIPMIKNVKQIHFIEHEPKPQKNSFKRLALTITDIKKHKTVAVFLIAYFYI